MDSMPPSDRVAMRPEALLLMQAADGDGQAFSTLARLLARPALAFAVRILGDAALAEDAVQEALARLWREAGRFDPERGSFTAWWRRMLLNCTLDGRRRLKSHAALDDVAEPADPTADIHSGLEADDLARYVQETMRALPARQRAALSLFYGEELSMAEIAAALGTTEKAVEGLLGRGRAQMKELLAAREGEWK